MLLKSKFDLKYLIMKLIKYNIFTKPNKYFNFYLDIRLLHEFIFFKII